MTPQAWLLIFTGIVLAIVCVCAFMRCKSSVRETEPLCGLVDWQSIDEFDADYGDFDSAGNKKADTLPIGWQGWEGGECPVPADTIVRVLYMDGELGYGFASDWDWHHGDNGGDIVAWRVAD